MHRVTKRLAVPRNKQELQSLLGMFNYLGKFVANLAVKRQDSMLW